MSADLFAEFNSLSNGKAPVQPASSSTSQTVSSGSNSAQIQDPFSFLSTPQPRSTHGFQSPNLNSLQHEQSISTDSWRGQSWSAQTSTRRPTTNNDDDGWGDFEVATPRPAHQSQFQLPAKSQVSFQGSTNESGSFMTGLPGPDVSGNQRAGLSSQPRPANVTQARRLDASDQISPAARKTQYVSRQSPKNPNVLFDAEEFELEGGEQDDSDDDDDDDFGEFETVTKGPQKDNVLWSPTQQSRSLPPQVPLQEPAPKPSVPHSMDLLGLDDPPSAMLQNIQLDSRRAPVEQRGSSTFGSVSLQSSPAAQPPKPIKSDSPGEILPKRLISKQTVETKPKNHDPPRKADPQVNDDDWGSWDDFSSTPARTQAEARQPTSSTWELESSENPQHSTRDSNKPPPTNVPPPSVILSAFPELFTTCDSLFKPITGRSTSIKERILSSPKTFEFLQAYLLLVTTAGRIIAGRKHRWHRDKMLAQSMSISSAGSKGMKIAGIDKTQSAREDREAEDVATAWKGYVGRVRSIVVAANSAGKPQLKVPELSGHMQVHTAKLVPTSPKPCVICGLKRDERVTKVDYEVEDSFGEWWADHWGHRSCKNFWIEHEQKLRQR